MTAPKVAVVVPFWGEQPHRLRNVLRVVKHLHQMLPHATVNFTNPHRGQGPWSLARAWNDSVDLVTSPQLGLDAPDVVVLHDADVLARRDALHAAIRGALTDGRIHLAHNSFRALSETGTERFLGGNPFAECEAEPGPKQSTATAGVLAFTPEAWAKIGGADERFAGSYGCDTALIAAAGTFLGEPVYHPGLLVHLWHPATRDMTNPDRIANQALRQRYLDARGDQRVMRALIASRTQDAHVSA